MSNTLLTADLITNEGLAVLENEIVFGKNVRRRYDDMFGNESMQAGDTVKIRKPDRGTYRSGATYSPDDITESSVDITLAQGGADRIIRARANPHDLAPPRPPWAIL